MGVRSTATPVLLCHIHLLHKHFNFMHTYLRQTDNNVWCQGSSVKLDFSDPDRCFSVRGNIRWLAVEELLPCYTSPT